MKNFLLLFLLMLSSLLVAQKHDNNWMMGGECDTTYTEGLVSIMDFNSSNPIITPNQAIEYKFGSANTALSDSLGNLLFYCNGNEVFNSQHELIENGGNLANEGDCGFQNLPQGIVAFPLPDSDSKFVFITASLEVLLDVNIYTITNLYYNVVDMNANNGEGELIIRQEPFLQDTLTQGKITACKHANGRDWWLLMFKYDSRDYYRCLFTPNGVESIDLLQTDFPVYAGLGQAVFSPNGNKYAQISGIDIVGSGGYIDIFDFDRCTGILNNQLQMLFPINKSGGIGAAISPNSRYLYTAIVDKIYQYDLWEEEIESSIDTVGIHDGYVEDNIWSTVFHLMQLAPNNKIYITTPSDGHFLHVIHQPNEKGIACDVELRGLEWPTWKNISLPSFPYYRLGVQEGSLCDTLSVAVRDIPEFENKISVFPNPASQSVYLEIEKAAFEKINIYTIAGQYVDTYSASDNRLKIDVSNYEDGIYLFEVFTTENEKIWKKVVVQR